MELTPDCRCVQPVAELTVREMLKSSVNKKIFKVFLIK